MRSVSSRSGRKTSLGVMPSVNICQSYFRIINGRLDDALCHIATCALTLPTNQPTGPPSPLPNRPTHQPKQRLLLPNVSFEARPIIYWGLVLATTRCGPAVRAVAISRYDSEDWDYLTVALSGVERKKRVFRTAHMLHI